MGNTQKNRDTIPKLRIWEMYPKNWRSINRVRSFEKNIQWTDRVFNKLIPESQTRYHGLTHANH